MSVAEAKTSNVNPTERHTAAESSIAGERDQLWRASPSAAVKLSYTLCLEKHDAPTSKATRASDGSKGSWGPCAQTAIMNAPTSLQEI